MNLFSNPSNNNYKLLFVGIIFVFSVCIFGYGDGMVSNHVFAQGTTSATVTIIGSQVPSTVGVVYPTAGDKQVSLSWTPPAVNGSVITDYIIQYSTDETTWVEFSDGDPSTSTTATVTGLNNDQLYYFSVAAVN